MKIWDCNTSELFSEEMSLRMHEILLALRCRAGFMVNWWKTVKWIGYARSGWLKFEVGNLMNSVVGFLPTRQSEGGLCVRTWATSKLALLGAAALPLCSSYFADLLLPFLLSSLLHSFFFLSHHQTSHEVAFIWEHKLIIWEEETSIFR